MLRRMLTLWCMHDLSHGSGMFERQMDRQRNWALLHQLTIIYLYTFPFRVSLKLIYLPLLTLPFFDLTLLVLFGLAVAFLTASHFPVFFFSPFLAIM